jgi:hypothetical protein
MDHDEGAVADGAAEPETGVDDENVFRKAEKKAARMEFAEANKWPIMLAVVLLVVGYVIYKFFFGDDDMTSGRVLAGSSSLHLRERACMATEVLCPGSAQCRGGNGQVASAAAKTAEGGHCCSFSCESAAIPQRL